MTIFILGLILFLGIHSTQIVAPGVREQVIRRSNPGLWKLSYALIAIIGLVLLVIGYGEVRHATRVLYQPPAGLRHLTHLLMLPVFPLLLAAYIKGHIQHRLGHPMVIAVIFWAVAHLLANGTLADVLLFGGFLLWAVLDWLSLRKRQPGGRPSGNRAGWLRNDIIAVVGGLVLYGAFVGSLHSALFGVAPI